MIATPLSRETLLVPFPLALWRVIGSLPNPPITVNKVDLMEQDNVAAPEIPGFGGLQIMPQPIEGVLGDILQKRSQVRVTPSDKLRRG